MRKFFPLWVLVFASSMATGSTYYVKPDGNDAGDGVSVDTAWKTCSKVNSTSFIPGDQILFQRGAHWRESLVPSTNGTQEKPITYDAFGQGTKPIFLGSDQLDNAKFAPAADRKWSYPMAVQADSALVNHVFVDSKWVGGRSLGGTLTITSLTDPRTDGKSYTACTRGNVVFSNRKNHLVFRNLIVDETAGQLNEGPNQGYGFRIEGSTDVVVENCEAYRVGRHHFAAINSTGFVGRHLKAAYVVPRMPGANTAYVSYADAGAPVAHCTSVWDDIQASNMDDHAGAKNLPFVSHGDHQGLITIQNSDFTDKISFMSAPAIVKWTTLHGSASIENFGDGILIDSVKLLDSSAIDQYGSDGTMQNCIANLTPSGGGPTGYGAAIVVRDKAKRNAIRFNTLNCNTFSCICLVGESSSTSWYGNILLSSGTTIAKPGGLLSKQDVARADFNFYSRVATLGGVSLDDWQRKGFDQHSISGTADLFGPAGSELKLPSDSPCIRAAKLSGPDLPPSDAAGHTRVSAAATIGAYELPSSAP